MGVPQHDAKLEALSPEVGIVLESLRDAIIASDESDSIIFLNSAAERLLGWTAQELLGRPLTAIMPARLHAAHETGFRRYVSTRQASIMGRPVRVPALHRLGNEIDIELTLSDISVGTDRTLLIATIRDLRERVELERRLDAQQKSLAQHAAMGVLLSAKSVEEAMPRLLEATARTLEWEVGLYWRLDAGRDRLLLDASWAADSRLETAFAHDCRDLTFAPGEGVLGSVLASLKPAWITHLANDTTYRRAALAAAHGLRTTLLFPVYCSQRKWGVLEFLTSRAVEPDQILLDTMQSLGFQVGQFLSILAAAEELKVAHQTAESERDNLRALFTQAPAAIAILHGPELRYEFSNPFNQELTGNLDLLGKTVREALPELVGSGVVALAEEVYNTGLPHVAKEYPVTLPARLGMTAQPIYMNGVLQPLRAPDGTVKGLMSFSYEVTELVESRKRLEEAEERLRLALEAAKMGTWEHAPDTHETHWDARSKEMFGYAPDEALTFERYQAALHPDDVERVFAGIAKAVDPAGSGECGMEYRIRAVDGTERWVEAHGRCVFADGVPVRIHGTLLDITSRRQAEQAILDAARRKDEFLALLGHELRNPLAPIKTALEVMRRHSPTHAVREREVIDRQVSHMTRLVEDLLDLSRVSRGAVTLRIEGVKLARVVARAIEMASPLFESQGHHLYVDVPEGLCVDADPDRLAQVIANLLTNAARYTPPGGQVWVRARASGDAIALEVQDSGIGISAQELTAIFEPFVQSARSEGQGHGGLGLGLSLVQDLTRLHGGQVEARSAGIDSGSCFVVTLPLGRLPVRDAAFAEPGERRSGHGRVLVIDDNEDAAEMLALLLEDRGYEVRTANDGPRALRAAEELPPDVAVIDLGMPVMDGFELAARLREAHGANVRLVALTGYGQAKDRERTQAAGFDAHLVKPVDLEQLEAALRA